MTQIKFLTEDLKNLSERVEFDEKTRGEKLKKIEKIVERQQEDHSKKLI